MPSALLWAFAPAPALSLSSIFPLLVLRTRGADKSQAADVLWVLRGVNSSDVPTHGGADQVEGPLVQLDALHELHGGRRSIVRAGEESCGVIREIHLKTLRPVVLAASRATQGLASLTSPSGFRPGTAGTQHREHQCQNITGQAQGMRPGTDRALPGGSSSLVP